MANGAGLHRSSSPGYFGGYFDGLLQAQASNDQGIGSLKWLVLILNNFFFSIQYNDLNFLVVSDNEITALNINSKESLWIDHHRGWRTADTDKDSGLSESKLLSHVNSSQSNYNNSDGGTDYAEVDTRNLTTFYNCRKVRII